MTFYGLPFKSQSVLWFYFDFFFSSSSCPPNRIQSVAKLCTLRKLINLSINLDWIFDSHLRFIYSSSKRIQRNSVKRSINNTFRRENVLEKKKREKKEESSLKRKRTNEISFHQSGNREVLPYLHIRCHKSCLDLSYSYNAGQVTEPLKRINFSNFPHFLTLLSFF